MGIATQEFIVTARATGRGTDYFGECEACRKSMSETWAFERRRVYVRAGGVRYLGSGSAMYGHKDCLNALFGPSVDQATLSRSGNVLLAPQQ